jgi:hypothetical protein
VIASTDMTAIIFHNKDKRTATISTYYDFFTYQAPDGKDSSHNFKSGKQAFRAILEVAEHLFSHGFVLKTASAYAELQALASKDYPAPLPFPAIGEKRSSKTPASARLRITPKAKHPSVSKRQFDDALKSLASKKKLAKATVKGPEAYRRFVSSFGAVRIGDVEVLGSARQQQSVFKRLVEIPREVLEDEGEITTEHLIPFAAQGPETVWCFCQESKNWWVYRHHQDEPAAIYVDSKKWIRGDLSRPDYRNFEDWVVNVLRR